MLAASEIGVQFALVAAAASAVVGAAIKAFEKNFGAALAYVAVGLTALAAAIGKL